MKTEELIKLPNRYRGTQHFEPEKCNLCNQCVNICPTDCITLTGKADPEKGNVIESFNINFELCILCDLCTEVCPTEALVMTNNMELAKYSRKYLKKDINWLDNNNTMLRK